VVRHDRNACRQAQISCQLRIQSFITAFRSSIIDRIQLSTNATWCRVVCNSADPIIKRLTTTPLSGSFNFIWKDERFSILLTLLYTLINCSFNALLQLKRRRGLLKFESRVSSIKTRVSSVKTHVSNIKSWVYSIKNGRIRCFLLIQLKIETRVLILETRYSIEHNTQRPLYIVSFTLLHLHNTVDLHIVVGRWYVANSLTIRWCHCKVCAVMWYWIGYKPTVTANDCCYSIINWWQT